MCDRTGVCEVTGGVGKKKRKEKKKSLTECKIKIKNNNIFFLIITLKID